MNAKVYVLEGKFYAKPFMRDKLFERLIKVSVFMENKVKGCRKYIVSKDAEDKDALVVQEEWDNKDDHDASLKLSEVQRLIKENMPLIDFNRK